MLDDKQKLESQPEKVGLKGETCDSVQVEETANFVAKKGNTDQDAARIQWDKPAEFLLTCVGYSVGLGNVWRFPYLCYQSGGGAFLIPYTLMIIVIGCPMLFMEYGFGQYFGKGALTIFKRVCPLFEGIGYCYMIINGFVCVYYNVIIALSIYYLFNSFRPVLPWGSCNNEWNTIMCTELTNSTNYTSSSNVTLNSTYNFTFEKTSPSKEFWEYSLLDVNESHSIDNLGSIRPYLCLSLFVSWILVVLFVSKGIKSTGKVAYVTATFPYLMLTVLVTRGVTLPGASEGIMYFLTPVWSKLADPKIWFSAASQLFYSTNIGWGGMITMASYNHKKHNCFRDALFINFISFFTSLYAGLAVFSIIGFMAEESGSKVADVIKSGPELAFIVYPRALSLMPIAQLWSVLFFIMLFTLGIGSLMVNLETVMTGLSDEIRIVRRYRFTATCLVASCMFLLALPQVTQGGMFVLSLFDHYAASFSLLFTTVAECIAINWIYGSNRFCDDVSSMLGKRPSFIWRAFWKVISPVVIIAIIIFSFVNSKGAKYGDYTYPVWGDCVGWLITLASILPIPIVAIVKLTKDPGRTLAEKYKNTVAVPPAPKEIELEHSELFIMRD